MRVIFRENFDESELAFRTKRIVELVANEIVELSPDKSKEEAMTLANNAINAAGVSTKESGVKGATKKVRDAKTLNAPQTMIDHEAKALFFMSKQQAKNLASLASEKCTDKKVLQNALNRNHNAEIALFGRMVADDPSLNADASAQVAHCISTHAVSSEYDYFTAMDDMKGEDEDAGAGMLGTVEFNSATLYRYATLASHNLFEQLGNETGAFSKAVSEFARAFVTAMPTGKQNTFANRTLPDVVMVHIRTDQPVNLAGAFESPIKAARGEGYRDASVKALREYADEVYADFADKPAASYVIGAGLEGVGEKVSLEGLISVLAGKVQALLGEN